MPYESQFTSEAQDHLLARTLQVVSGGGLAVLDLDGVLFDTRVRQVRIVREYARLNNASSLMDIQVQHFWDWSMTTTLVRMGLPRAVAANYSKEMRPFWEEAFFGPRAVLWDAPMPGAPEWVLALLNRGARIVYLTGRTESQRACTIDSFEDAGFPIKETTLIMKPKASLEDHRFKAAALEHIGGLGTVALGIDNEPIQINQLSARFPSALSIWMHTDHSFRDVKPDPSLPILRGFLTTPQG